MHSPGAAKPSEMRKLKRHGLTGRDQQSYSAEVQQRHRPRTTPTSRQQTATCPNDRERPRRQEFASRGSRVSNPLSSTSRTYFEQVTQPVSAAVEQRQRARRM